MSRYISEITLAPQAVDAMIKNPHIRADAIAPLFESAGGKLIEYYFGVGQNNVFIIYELPDDITVEAVIMATFAGGAITSAKTTSIITSAEAVEAMKKAADIAYQPPSAQP